jgi:hypothetical protein
MCQNIEFYFGHFELVYKYKYAAYGEWIRKHMFVI